MGQCILHLGWLELMTGPREALVLLEDQAIRLSLRDAKSDLWHGRIGCVHLLQSRIGEASVWLEKRAAPCPRR